MTTAQHRAGAITVRHRIGLNRGRRTLPLLIVGVLVGLGASSAFAERWQVLPHGRLRLGYDDNVRLTSVAQQGAFLAGLSAALRAVVGTEVNEVGLAFGLDGTRYAGLAGADNTDGYVGVDLASNRERHQFRLSTRLTSQSTMSSEVATTGLVQVNRQQTQVLVNPTWSYLLSERATIDVTGSYQDVHYQDVQALPLFNYQYGTIDLGGSYSWSERLKLTGRTSYGRYTTQGSNNAYDSVGAEAGAAYRLSETTLLEFIAGLRRTSQTFNNALGLRLRQDSSGPIYVLRFSERLEPWGSVKLELRRMLEPSGSGQLLDTTGVVGGLSFPVRPRWLFSLDASGYRNSNPGGRSSLSDRRYMSVTPRLSYELDESWRLSMAYWLRWQKRNEIPGDAISNALFLTLSWTPLQSP